MSTNQEDARVTSVFGGLLSSESVARGDGSNKARDRKYDDERHAVGKTRRASAFSFRFSVTSVFRPHPDGRTSGRYRETV